MRLSLHLSILLFSIQGIAHAQDSKYPSLNIGDTAPSLRVKDWLKGSPVRQFERDKVYVLEFWATWCKPCMAGMSHLSTLAEEYKDKVIVIGVDIYEEKVRSLKPVNVKAFVDSMGNRMGFSVATEDTNFTVADWIEASAEENNGIPRTFVIDYDGKLAWIGHPKDLDSVLPKIATNNWDIQQALNKRNADRYLKELDDSLNYELRSYAGDYNKGDYIGQPDSALMRIHDIVTKEPRLKYAPFIAYNTFSALLKTNPHEAYEYGKVVLTTSTYESPFYDAIIGNIQWYSDKLELSEEIYELGAEAYQVELDQIVYPEMINMSKIYSKMAECYYRADNKSKAIQAQQKAIELLKNKKDFSAKELTPVENRLRQYKSMKRE